MGVIYSLIIITEQEMDIDPLVDVLRQCSSETIEFDVWDEDEFLGEEVTDNTYHFCLDTQIHQPPAWIQVNRLPTADIYFYSPQLNRKSRCFEISIVSRDLRGYENEIEAIVIPLVYSHIPEASLLIFAKDLPTDIEDRVLQHYEEGIEELRDFLQKINTGYLRLVYPSGEIEWLW